LRKLVESILEDYSSKEVFLFRATCVSCGTEYASRPVLFSKFGVSPATQNKEIIYEAVFEQEHRAARQTAIRDVAEHMNYCPICKKLVCNRCFLICDDLDMCRRCALRLGETGRPVLPEIAEATSEEEIR